MAVRDAVIVDIVRSPMGKGKVGGALSAVHPVDLLAQVLRALVRRTGIDPGTVEDVLIGCVSQVGEQSATPGRMALLAAGFPEHVPAATIDRKCGSSQQAVQFAAQGVIAGGYDIVIAGGVESMSRVVMGSARAGADPNGEGVAARYAPGLVGQGVAAELVAARWKLDRERLDAFAARSHQRAAAAAAAGRFDHEIVPVTVPGPDGPTAVGPHAVDVDETIRPQTTAAALGGLTSPFYREDLARRFPEIGWHITAGSSSPFTDGASAALIMERGLAERMGLTPRARFAAFAQLGDDPLLMLTATIPASERALQRAGLTMDQMDLVEVNEAFASVPLAFADDLGVDEDRLNVNGGAIALGHPLGASGTRVMATLVNELAARGVRYGLQTFCEAGGMANATIIERL